MNETRNKRNVSHTKKQPQAKPTNRQLNRPHRKRKEKEGRGDEVEIV